MTPVPFDPTTLSDEDLLAAITVARQRLPHEATCEHCAGRAEVNHRQVIAARREVAEFNDKAARAGFLISGNRHLVHRWDCPSMQSQIRLVERFRTSNEYEAEHAHGADMSLPTVATLDEARAFVDKGKTRRGCRTCAPDL